MNVYIHYVCVRTCMCMCMCMCMCLCMCVLICVCVLVTGPIHCTDCVLFSSYMFLHVVCM